MYALVDCNNFYCSCERVFNPKLEGKPVIVLSNNDGCAISRSEEAKKLGIPMASPAFMMEPLIKKHGVAVFSSNYTLYGDISSRIMQMLSSFVPAIETYSIDEAFLDMTDLRYTDLLSLGFRIRKTIVQNTGIPVTVGIAPTKALAKMANRYAKKTMRKDGVYWAANADLISEMLSATDISDVWGIGHQYAILLKRNGFQTAADFARASDDWVRTNMSVVGLRLLYELRGIPSIQFEEKTPSRKNICTSRSFGKRLSEKSEIAEALANYVAIVALKLRNDKSCCNRINIFIQTNPHKTGEAQYNHSIDIDLERPTNHTSEIMKVALKGLDIIFKEGILYMKCGIIVSNLVQEDSIQQSFFEYADQARNKTIMKTVDSVNGAFGKETVRMATQGFEKRYRLKAEKLSPCYTTRLDQVLKIAN